MFKKWNVFSRREIQFRHILLLAFLLSAEGYRVCHIYQLENNETKKRPPDTICTGGLFVLDSRSGLLKRIKLKNKNNQSHYETHRTKNLHGKRHRNPRKSFRRDTSFMDR